MAKGVCGRLPRDMRPPFSPRGENGPRPVQKRRKEGDFDFPLLDLPLKRLKGGGSGPLLWIPPPRVGAAAAETEGGSILNHPEFSPKPPNAGKHFHTGKGKAQPAGDLNLTPQRFEIVSASPRDGPCRPRAAVSFPPGAAAFLCQDKEKRGRISLRRIGAKLLIKTGFIAHIFRKFGCDLERQPHLTEQFFQHICLSIGERLKYKRWMQQSLIKSGCWNI